MRMLFRYIRPYLKRMCLGLSIKFSGSVVELFLPWCLAFIIDTVIPRKSIPQILFWGGVMLLCSLIAWVNNILANRMASKVARDTTERLRRDLFAKISDLSAGQVDKYSIPTLISRLTTDTYNVHQMVGMMQRLGVRAPILLLGGIIVTLTLEPVLALVLISTLPFIGGIAFWISKKGIPLYTSLQQGIDRMVRTVRENIIGIRVIKALSKTEYEKGRFSQVNADVVAREKKAGMTMSVTNPTVNLFLNVGLTVVIIVGAYRVNAGISQAGKIIAFMTYFTIILNAMLAINRMFVMLSKGSASANRINEIFELPHQPVLLPPDEIETPYHVSFDHVSFSYHKKERNISDISFQIKRGQTLGIIGATGSGKSTIINLLMRFYDADEGMIRIDGRDVRTIPPEELHTKFGVVFQNDVLFADTIAENIAFGREISREDLLKAAENAQAREFIDSLEEGLDYPLAIKAANLSGGQKQRVLISRALARKPEILVLDDSSSALDYKTDARLRKAIRENFQGTTTIIIAQRVSSILHADLILMLEDGCAIGCGTHEELMENCESYREISRSQMGGGNLE